MSYMLLLEDDQHLLDSIAELFLSEGFEVIPEMDSSNSVARVMEREPGVILMSEDMPPLEGVELLPLLRRLTRSPIIVMGVGGETAVVKALLLGADVYLKKPINFRELLTRVRSLFRNSQSGNKGQSSEISYVTCEQDGLMDRLRSSLTKTEERLLSCLLERQGETVKQEDLMVRVWGGPVKVERLRFYIHSLRRKLTSESFSLLTQNGVGYRLLPLT